ncbi:MAG TPA: thiamine phosphate synthase, partial [Plasticicumulans sp.]|nr:thiamine phosphate synthase [Plasticicumulans sp.]
MTERPRPHGLYAITDPGLIPDGQLLERVSAAIDGGARTIQYRDKRADAALRRQLAAALAGLCRARAVTLIINDDVALAAETGADGVHLGRDDAAFAAARRRLGARALIGVSCYDSLERARAACAAGADYVAFGAFYPSAIKPDAVRAPLSLLGEARHALARRIPIVAIGGIDAGNGAGLVEAGADALAVN